MLETRIPERRDPLPCDRRAGLFRAPSPSLREGKIEKKVAAERKQKEKGVAREEKKVGQAETISLMSTAFSVLFLFPHLFFVSMCSII